MSEPKGPARRERSRARFLGTATFGVVVAGLTTVFSIQIITQAWSDGSGETDLDCHAGVRALVLELDRARQSAASAAGEMAAVTAFRRELGGVWQARAGVRKACAQDQTATALLGSLLQLRYAEEQAVRYGAKELASQRRAVELAAHRFFSQP